MAKGFTSPDVPSQQGKTFFVTGANTGIGFETALVLAERGARVLIGCRSRAKGEAAVARIAEACPDAEVVLVDLDLGDLASVRKAAEVVGAEPRLDGLINNAGVMMCPRALTVDGFESQLGVNHLGPFALTGLLLPLLESTEGSRIVNTASNAHKGGKMFWDDLTAEESYSSLTRYNQSKLANLLHTFSLNRRLRAKGSSTIAVTVHPGATASDLGRHLPNWLWSLAKLGAGPLMNTPAMGAWPTLMGATSPDVEGGQYFGPASIGEIKGPGRLVQSTARSRDPELAKRLWDVSVELTGVDPGI